MGILGIAIIISLLIWLVFGWEYMTDMWESAFEWIGQIGEAILNNTRSP